LQPRTFTVPPPREVFRVGPVVVTETVVNTWLIMAVVIVVAYLLARRLRRIPRGAQMVLEMIYEGVESLVVSAMGPGRRGFLPYVGTLMVFIFLSNISGLFGLRPPTADLNTTLGLALITFFSIHYFSIKTKGLRGYLRSWLEPIPLFLPFNITGELAKPISLSFRLFGNILGGYLILGLVYFYAPVLIPVPFHAYFDLFVGFLQTFIFAILSMVLIALAME